MRNAGLVARGDREFNERVSKFFTQGIAASAQAGYARASTGSTFNDVYYLPVAFTEEQILHESLHTFLGAGDAKLNARHADAGSLMHGGCNLGGEAF
jgi:hypothetical protein